MKHERTIAFALVVIAATLVLNLAGAADQPAVAQAPAAQATAAQAEPYIVGFQAHQSGGEHRPGIHRVYRCWSDGRVEIREAGVLEKDLWSGKWIDIDNR